MLLMEDKKVLMQNKEIRARAKASLKLHATILVRTATWSMTECALRKDLNVERTKMTKKAQKRPTMVTQIWSLSSDDTSTLHVQDMQITECDIIDALLIVNDEWNLT